VRGFSVVRCDRDTGEVRVPVACSSLADAVGNAEFFAENSGGWDSGVPEWEAGSGTMTLVELPERWTHAKKASFYVSSTEIVLPPGTAGVRAALRLLYEAVRQCLERE
jgi:hypothetical protein